MAGSRRAGILGLALLGLVVFALIRSFGDDPTTGDLFGGKRI